MDQALPPVQVVIEVPRGGFIKRRPDGTVDFISPVPCPFNYGSVHGLQAADGDPQDALVLGERRKVGEVCLVRPWARVCFMDNGVVDDKWVCGDSPPTAEDSRRIRWFFSCYAWAKVGLNQIRGRKGPTRFMGLEPLDGIPAPASPQPG